jgi:hypothetical protein
VIFIYKIDYDRVYLIYSGFCGSTAIDDEDAIVEFTLDDTKYDGSHPALMG